MYKSKVSRNHAILEERSRGANYKTIAANHGVSVERVRQICSKLDVNELYRHSCISLRGRGVEDLKLELELASTRSREGKYVVIRRALIRHLRNELRMSFGEIADLLDRDIKTIKSLYETKAYE